MSKLAILKVMGIGSFAVGAATAVALGVANPEPADASPRAEESHALQARPTFAGGLVGAKEERVLQASANASFAAIDVAADDAACDEPCEGTCEFGEHGDAVVEPADPVQAAFDACAHLLDEAPGDTRFELALSVSREPEGGVSLEGVEVTQGKKLPCLDGVDFDDPDRDADAVQFPAMAECIANTLELDAMHVEGGEAGQEFTIERAIGGPPQPLGLALPDPSPATAGLDPTGAIDELRLPKRGATGDASVQIVECGDYDCPFCNRARETVDALLEKHPEVAMHWLHRPLPMHEHAVIAAAAAVAAENQGKFWEMHAALFDQRELRSEAALVKLAAELGLDTDRFARDLVAEDTLVRIADQNRVCEEAGAPGTPAFFINGDLVTGAVPLEELSRVIEDELAP